MDVSSAGVSVSECSIEVTYLDFDSLDTIEVPREAVEATEDAGPDSYDDYEENIFGDIDAGADPIEPADSLGRSGRPIRFRLMTKFCPFRVQLRKCGPQGWRWIQNILRIIMWSMQETMSWHGLRMQTKFCYGGYG